MANEDRIHFMHQFSLCFPCETEKALFESSANLPSPVAPAAAAAVTSQQPRTVAGKKEKSVPRPSVDLSQRQGVVLYGTLTVQKKSLLMRLFHFCLHIVCVLTGHFKSVCSKIGRGSEAIV